jgi:predicted TIM-barrel fold metal-dependent hydrolase
MSGLYARRRFLKIACGATSLCAVKLCAVGRPQTGAVPWSAGTELPGTKTPAGATDCHHHIYDLRFPVDPYSTLRPGDATVQDYRLLQQRLGITRHVVVQPSTYGFDNRCMLDALKQFGLLYARGIAAVSPDVTDNELKRLDATGVRGIRFNLGKASATSVDMVKPLAHRIAALGWHVQINTGAEQIAAAADVWKNLPCTIVFDHLAHVREPADDSPGFVVVSELLQSGRAWVKLSGAYIDSKLSPPSYSDRTAIARAYVRLAPERLVWGTDWPHPTAKKLPDDAQLLDLLAEWIPDVKMRNRVLVDNPATLYGF